MSGAASIGAVGKGEQIHAWVLNVISWSSMITIFVKHGFASKAMEMFHKMLEDGVRPNEITYIAAL